MSVEWKKWKNCQEEGNSIMNFTTWNTPRDAVIGTTCIRNISGDHLICRFWSPPQIHCCWISQRCYCCSFSHVWLLATPGTAAFQASLSFTSSQNLFKLMSIESVMPSNLLCHPFLSLPSIFPSTSIFSTSLHQVAKVLELQHQHQSFPWIFRVDFL